MLDKLISLFKLPTEYGNELKVIWIGDEVEVINYGNFMKYYSSELVFSKIIIKGDALKLVYQDPNVVKIKGKIKEIYKGEL